MDAPSEITLCTGDVHLISATINNKDYDELIWGCAGDCGRSGEKKTIADELSLEWQTSVGQGTFFGYNSSTAKTNGKRSSILYQSPKSPGRYLIKLDLKESGIQALDNALTLQSKEIIVNVEPHISWHPFQAEMLRDGTPINPLFENGYDYHIYFSVCDNLDITDKVVVANVIFNVEIEYEDNGTNRTGTWGFNYWEAFEIGDNRRTKLDHHFVDIEKLIDYGGLEKGYPVYEYNLIRMTVQRTHHVYLGEVENVAWASGERPKFCYVALGPNGEVSNPRGRPSNEPQVKPGSRVKMIDEATRLSFQSNYTFMGKEKRAIMNSDLGKKPFEKSF